MKKTKLINQQVSSLIASLGHTDWICISDAGLPMPKGVGKIDLAVRLGLPKFWDVLKVVSSEAKFEKVLVAQEVTSHFPNFVTKVKSILGKECSLAIVPHTTFKKKLSQTKAIIRTGHNEWYHNIILQAGVTF